MASMIKRKPRFATPIVVAVDSFVTSALEEYGPFSVAAGTRLKADHPVVGVCPDFFAEDGVDDAELIRRRTALYMASMPPVEPPKPVVPAERRLDDEDALVNIFDGSRVRKGSPEAKRRPGDYAPVVPSGLNRRDAVVAMQEMRVLGVGGKQERVVRANTWVHRDDPLVELHPFNFRMPDALEPVRTPAASNRTEA
jgi:hypothetical protein